MMLMGVVGEIHRIDQRANCPATVLMMKICGACVSRML